MAVRPGSLSKPIIIDFKSRGVEILPLDVAAASSDDLLDAVKGVDTVICPLVYSQLSLQLRIIDAAKSAGVKRFIPSDFSIPGLRGIRKLHDEVIHPSTTQSEL